jgi:hypothetical protein
VKEKKEVRKRGTVKEESKSQSSHNQAISPHNDLSSNQAISQKGTGSGASLLKSQSSWCGGIPWIGLDAFGRSR